TRRATAKLATTLGMAPATAPAVVRGSRKADDRTDCSHRSIDGGEYETTRVCGSVVDVVGGGDHVVFGFLGAASAGVGVVVVAWEVGAGDLEADAVAGEEHVGGGGHVDRDLVDLARGHQRGLAQGVAVAHALEAFAEEDGTPVGEHVDELRGEVGV